MQRHVQTLAILASVLAAFGAQSTPASASLIATDTYAIGSSPTQGQYVAGTVLKSQPGTLVNTGFVNGAYASGSGTSQFSAQNGTLAYAPFGTPPSNPGMVSYGAAYLDGATRSNARSFTAAATATAGGSTGTSLWFNVLVSSDGTSTLTGNNGTGTTVTVGSGAVLASFGNSIAPYAGVSGNYSGLAFGFASHSASDTNDLVIRYRSGSSTDSDATLVSNTSGTYDIVAKLDVNYGGGSTDYLTYWVNPTDFSSQAALDSSSLLTNDTGGLPNTELATFASQGIGSGSNADFTRLTYTSQNWNGNANFGDLAFGTTLGDISNALVNNATAVPEPASVAMLGLGMVGVMGLAIRRRARVQA